MSFDPAILLADEFETWFRNLAAQGELPRAFTGVTQAGGQAVVVLSGLPLNHVQRREFLIWLCREEQFNAYAYGSHVAIAADPKTPTISEALDIYASSDLYDVSRTLGIERSSDGTHRFRERHRAVLPAGPDNGLFFGLNRAIANISPTDQELFSSIWNDLNSKAMWRQR